MRALIRDLGHALRQLRKSPGFSLVVVVMLALGIGANTAIFSVMNTVLFQLLPVERPQGLFYVHEGHNQSEPPGASDSGDSNTSFSLAAFEALRRRSDVFEELIARVPLSLSGNVAVRHGELPEEAEGDEVSGNFFSGLSARIVLGRGFTLADESSHAAVAVLSYDYWTRSYARDPAVVGQTLYVKGVPMTIVGVAARGFHGVENGSATDFWIPLQTRPELTPWGIPFSSQNIGNPRWWCLRLMARLRPGITPAQAQQAMEGTFGEAARQAVGSFNPKEWQPLLDFVPVRGIGEYNENTREPVDILMGLVALVLLIACTNVAMMVQARNVVREREFSVRLAIGAGRAAIFRQLLSESLLLVTAGAALGWFFAVAATRMLAAWSDIETGLNPDRTVLLFTLGVSCLAALTFGLAPLWSAVHAPVAGVLRSSSTGVTAGRKRVLGGRMVLAAQMAVCLVLLTAAGLLLRTLRNYTTQNLGMEAQELLVFGVTPQGQIDPRVFYRTLLDRLRQVPGVESVSFVENRPGSGWVDDNPFALDGASERGQSLLSNNVGPGFFHTVGIPILAGRDIAETDAQNTQVVAVVNEAFVKKYLPNTNPLGHQLGQGKGRIPIVGVVRDSKYNSVAQGALPTAYYGQTQWGKLGTMNMEVRTRGNAKALIAEMRRVIASLYPNVPLEKPMTQQAQFEESYMTQRMFAVLGGFFGVLAALLVAAGLYGAHSFRVSRRTTEIGVRIALGATRAQVLTMVLRDSVWVLAGGLAAGIPLTLLAVRPLKAMLYQLSPFDLPSFAAAVAAIVVVSACAALIPARRAASIDPMQALRAE